MRSHLLKRIILFSLILVFLVADYFSLAWGLSILDEIKKSGLLNFIFPFLYISIIAIAVISVRGRVLNLGLKRSIAAIIVLALATIYFINIKDAQGKVHFLEYELITLLVFKALEIDIKGKIIHLLTFICLMTLGIIEEVAQSLYPERTFDVGDLKIDMISAIFMIVLIGIFIRKSD